VAFALNDTAWFHQFRQEVQPTLEYADACITFSADRGVPVWASLAMMSRGWALAMCGQGEEGIQQIHQGLADYQAMEAKALFSQFLGMLAQAYGATGQIEEGLTTLAEALAHVRAKGEGLYEAELYRLKGELTLQQLSVASNQLSVANPQSPTPNPRAEAEACFLKAIEVARTQQAKSLELRATISLARLWQQQDKKKEAYELLAPVYNWFTEGFDTKDLQEAKALLDALQA
jgi:predicted ATPase